MPFMLACQSAPGDISYVLVSINGLYPRMRERSQQGRLDTIRHKLDSLRQPALKQDQTGFTVMELIIVIAVIGIMAVLVLNSVVGAQASARDAKRRHDIASIRRGLVGYSIDTGTALVAGAGKVGTGNDGLGWFNFQGAPDYTGLSIETALHNSGYIADGIIDPQQGSQGYMIYPCAGSSLVGVFAKMEKPGTTDAAKIADWSNRGCPTDPINTYSKNSVEVVPLTN